MNLRQALLSCLLLLLVAGCSGIPREQAGRFDHAYATYKSVKAGTPREDLESKLGPGTVQQDGSLLWEERFDDGNYVQLRVQVDANGKATRCETTRAKKSGKGSFWAGSVITKEN